MDANIPNETISTYISSALGCSCGCAGHTSYFLVYKNNHYYEYKYDAIMVRGSCVDYSYKNVKPIITQIPILTFHQFYDAFEDNNASVLTLIDKYWNVNTIKFDCIDDRYFYFDTYDNDNKINKINIDKCLKYYHLFLNIY